MINKIRFCSIQLLAAFTVGFASISEADAANFSSVARNINKSIEELPGLLTSFAYMFGLLLGVLGIMKIKDHVENPSNTPLKDGAVRMAAGGALFALPIVYEAMSNTIGVGAGVEAATLSRAKFNVS